MDSTVIVEEGVGVSANDSVRVGLLVIDVNVIVCGIVRDCVLGDVTLRDELVDAFNDDDNDCLPVTVTAAVVEVLILEVVVAE